MEVRLGASSTNYEVECNLGPFVIFFFFFFLFFCLLVPFNSPLDSTAIDLRLQQQLCSGYEIGREIYLTRLHFFHFSPVLILIRNFNFFFSSHFTNIFHTYFCLRIIIIIIIFISFVFYLYFLNAISPVLLHQSMR